MKTYTEHITRGIHEITDGRVLQESNRYTSRPRNYRPAKMSVVYTWSDKDNYRRTVSVTLSGKQIKKDGTPGLNYVTDEYGGTFRNFRQEDIAGLPQDLQQIVLAHIPEEWTPEA